MAPDECEFRDELHALPVDVGTVEAEEQVHGEYGEESVLGEGRQIIVGVQARILLGVEVVDGGRSAQQVVGSSMAKFGDVGPLESEMLILSPGCIHSDRVIVPRSFTN